MKNDNPYAETKILHDDKTEIFHYHCFACGQTNQDGLQLQFESKGDQVTCHTTINEQHQGYSGLVHGGIIATLMDAAMVRCLHNRFNQSPLTCRLDIRYLKSIPTNMEITIAAFPKRRRGFMCWAEGVVLCNGHVYAKGRGTFKLQENANISSSGMKNNNKKENQWIQKI
ncbi:MAG: PaaI family thioesterase [Bacteroidetes bacterium]|nr:PaaI family thioesterase [Bacteroidota bacterium]